MELWELDEAERTAHTDYLQRAVKLARKATKIRAENAKLREALADVDGVIATYGIDTIGTGSAPSQKEQERVDKITEAACDRFEASRANRST